MDKEPLTFTCEVTPDGRMTASLVHCQRAIFRGRGETWNASILAGTNG